jgi:hypothetical protein
VRWPAPDASSSTVISSPPTAIIASKCGSAQRCQGGHELEICLQNKATMAVRGFVRTITKARTSAPTPIFSTSAKFADPDTEIPAIMRDLAGMGDAPRPRHTRERPHAGEPRRSICSWIFTNPGASRLCLVSRVYLRVRLPIGEGSPGDFLP